MKYSKYALMCVGMIVCVSAVMAYSYSSSKTQETAHGFKKNKYSESNRNGHKRTKRVIETENN